MFGRNPFYCCRVGDKLNERYDAMCAMAGFTPRIFLNGADLDIVTTLVRRRFDPTGLGDCSAQRTDARWP